jgi:ribose-phosphate pyrophosphokinase
VEGRDVVLVDDICSTGETLKKAAEVCRRGGCRKIYAAVTHGLLLAKALEGSMVEKMVVTNTVQPGKDSWRIETVSVAPLFAKAIEAIVQHQSISSLSLSPKNHFWGDTNERAATSW